MQRLLFGLLAVLALLGLPIASQAQTAITTTTITEPITSTQPTTITVNSATGISAGIFLLIDNELMRVAQSYSTGTSIPVLRGRFPTTHADNSIVWVVPQAATRTRAPQGSCTRGEGDASFTHTFVDGPDATGVIAVCRNDMAGATGVERTWIVTDISGKDGMQSPNPPATP